MVDILVYNYVKLSELEELLSQPGYMCYGHGTGRKGNSEEVVDSIFDKGLRTKDNSLCFTTIGLSTPTPELKNIAKELNIPEPSINDLEKTLNNWEHEDSKKIIIARLPIEYINKTGDSFDRNGEMFGAFYNTITQENGKENYYLDPRFIIGCYDVEKQAVKLNPKYEPILSKETIEKLETGLEEAKEKTKTRLESFEEGYTSAEVNEEQNEEIIEPNLELYDDFNFPPIDWNDTNDVGKSR